MEFELAEPAAKIEKDLREHAPRANGLYFIAGTALMQGEAEELSLNSHRPNIVYVHSHDTGRYVQPYGHAVATPNIQKLAEEGVLFRQAFSASPTCSPSRTSLLTGQCPHRSGMLGLAHRGFRLNDPKRHIAHTLQGAGYETAMVGQQHMGRYVNGWEQVDELGYVRILDREATQIDAVRNAAVAFVKEPHERPFFLSVGFFETHRPFDETPDPRDNPRYTLPPSSLPDTPAVRRDMAAFKASARRLDAAMGEVFDAIEAAGLADNTVVVCTTDHGIAFPGMKCTLTDRGTGVMLIIRGPGGFEGGKVVDELVSQIDLFPTLCDLLAIEHPAWLDGCSFLPLINGATSAARSEIFAEVNYHAAYEPMRSARTKRWKYIRRYDDRPGPVLANCDDSPSRDVLLESGWKTRAEPQELLFDLVFDPNEANNLADRAQWSNELADMRRRLDAWMDKTDDPLRRGPILLPEGATVNSREQTSASEPKGRAI